MNKREPELEQDMLDVPAAFLLPENNEVQVNSLEEAKIHIQSLTDQVRELKRKVSDHGQRFDTLQTPFWKRIWFKIDGWPWYNLNGEQKKRPWHRGDK